MEDDSKDLNEKDAVPTEINNSALVKQSEEVIEEIETSESNQLIANNHQIVNNNMLLSQSNTSSMMTFNGCNGITLGTVVNVGWSPGRSSIVNKPVKTVAKLDESVYRKTPTIKEMLESNEPISPAFLDCVSANFGARWKEITILLKINQLFVERMYEDYFDKGGIKEVKKKLFLLNGKSKERFFFQVIFQILSNYLKDNQSYSTVGWLTTYLWNNGFRRTVWTVKEHYKELKRLEREFD